MSPIMCGRCSVFNYARFRKAVIKDLNRSMVFGRHYRKTMAIITLATTATGEHYWTSNHALAENELLNTSEQTVRRQAALRLLPITIEERCKQWLEQGRVDSVLDILKEIQCNL